MNYFKKYFRKSLNGDKVMEIEKIINQSNLNLNIQ